MLINSAVTVSKLLSAKVPEELPLEVFVQLHDQLGLDFEVHAGKVQIPFEQIGSWFEGIDLSTKSDSTVMVERSVS